MSVQPLDRQASLQIHDERVRRWARDCDDRTLHPILLVLGYGTDLETGACEYRVDVIASRMARYTPGHRKPHRATVFRQLVRLESVGIVKTETRHTTGGRQRTSLRYVDFTRTLRFGQAVEHFWNAPCDPGCDPSATPDATPRSILSSSHVSIPPLSGQKGQYLEPSQKKSAPAGRKGRDHASALRGAPADICNSYWVRQDGSFRKTTENGAAVSGKPGEVRVDLSPAEAKTLWSSQYGPRGKLTDERLGYMARRYQPALMAKVLSRRSQR